MRKIKFRAWDGIRMTTSGIMFNTSIGEMNVPNGANMELMQFAGLYDKNGVEIYEGDKIKAMHGFVEYGGNVIFDGGCFCIDIKYSSDGVNGHAPDYDIHGTPELNNFDLIEVIGNIHDKKEDE